MKTLVLILLFPVVCMAATLSKVRVFYDDTGMFSAKYIRVGNNSPVKGPSWSTGFCDILAKDWIEKDAHVDRVRVNPIDCSFYQVNPSVDESIVQDFLSILHSTSTARTQKIDALIELFKMRNKL